ncbi:hypothetical protein AAK894_07605 [Lachnospiraceae bacterium 46-61]
MYYNHKSNKISANEAQNNIITGTTGCTCGNVENNTTPTMPNSRYLGLQGIVTNISNLNDDGCTKLFEVRDQNGRITNFVITPSTYFINQANIARGMSITVFYDADAPAVLIYPPRLQAVVVASNNLNKNVKVDYFDSNLLSQDKALQLNIDENTEVILENGQTFTGNLGNHYLIVIYTNSTRSIPAQTTPEKVIVLCQSIS